MGYAKANSWAAEFADESIASYFASVMTTVSAVGASAAQVDDFIKDHGQEIYATAKETWPKLSADMQANFKQSMSSIADGIVVAGDWITAALDAMRPHLETIDSSPAGDGKFIRRDGQSFYFLDGYTLKFADGRTTTYHEIKATMISGGKVELRYMFHYSAGHYYRKEFSDGANIYKEWENLDNVWSVVNFMNAYGDHELLPVSLYFDNVAVPMPQPNSYNRIDKWLRDVAIPAGNLGVYAPSEAWTTNGYRLGLSEDGQQLLTLPDGLPYDPAIHGQYSWRKPLTQVIDGVPAVLNPTTWDWVNARDKTIVRPAEIPDIAEYTGTDIDTAEKIKENTKTEGSEGTTNGKLKNPTKKLVWTPLMMAGTAMTTKFPFSLPWDLMGQLKIFDAAPQAPKFEVNIPEFLKIEDTSIPLRFTIDLSMFDKVATMVRWFNIIIWDIALILILRKLLPE